MSFNKKHFIVIGINLIICISAVFIGIKAAQPTHSIKEEVIKEVEIKSSDFDALNNTFKFDVSDLAYSEVNTIDINSKTYSSGITVLDSDFKISEELLNKINNTINSYGASTSFYIVSLEDGMSIGYNVDKAFETASSIKAPYALYVYKEIAKGNVDPKAKLTYESKYYNEGTGVIKKSSFGTQYTIEQLVYYSLNDSDNIAHEMLHRNFGVSGYNEMLKNLGTKQLYLTAGNPWGFTSARSAALVWQEIYNFSLESDVGIELLNILSNGKYNYFKEVMPSIPSASKTGFAKKDVVETGIVFDDKPYIAVAIANKGGNIGAYTQVLKLVNYMNDIMNEYKDYLSKK